MTNTFKIPTAFEERIKKIHGENGKQWIKDLPSLIDQAIESWQLSNLKLFPNLSYNLVFEGQRADLGSIVLKVSVPNSEFHSEINALRRFRGNCCVRLLESDEKNGLLLLEKATPGTTLKEYTLNGRDLEAVSICANVIQKLHTGQNLIDSTAPNPTLADRMLDFSRLKLAIQQGNAPFELSLWERAENEYQNLLSTTSRTVLLHGDLHHDNILSSQRSPWLAIDPHGVIGDPAFEVAGFMRNPYPGVMKLQNVKAIMKNRIDVFSGILYLEKRRIWGWSFAQTTLASGWVFEDQHSG